MLHHRSILGFALGCAALTSCAREAEVQAPRAVGEALLERLPLTPLEVAPALEQPRTLLEFGALFERTWTRGPGSSGQDLAFGMRYGDSVSTRIELAGLDELPTRAPFRCVVPVPHVARASFFAGDDLLTVAEVLLRAGPENADSVFDVPELLFGGVLPTHVEIELERLPLGAESAAFMHPVRLELERAAPGGLLPEHGRVEFAGPRSLGRRSATLALGARLGSVAQVPENAELRFSFCAPDEYRHPDSQPSLRVRRRGAGLERVTEHPAAPVGAADPWVSVELPLSEFADAEVELEFEWTPLPGPPLLGLVSEPWLARGTRDAPVVVLITSDTHRGDHFGGAADSVDVETPFLEGLAAEGVLFLDARSTANSTNPSHAALMTGLHAAQVGIIDNDTPLSEVAPTLAEAFRAAGWVTSACVSAVHLGPEWSGFGQGFDRYSSPIAPQRDSDVTLAELRSQLDGTAGLPLFLWFHLFDAHAPYTPPAGAVDRYYPADRDPRDPNSAWADPERRPAFDRTIMDPDYTEALYRAEVTYLDGQLRRLLDMPRLAGAIVGLTADHGENLALDPLPFEHVSLGPATLDVPLLLYGPGVPKGRIEAWPAMNVDLGRTLLNLAGLAEAEFPGANLLEERGFEPAAPRFAIESYGISASIERGDDLLQLTLEVPLSAVDRTGTRPPRHGVRLYDLASDPHLTSDRSEAERRLAAELRGLLIEWLVAASPGSFVGEGLAAQDVAAQLELLGYTAGGDAAPIESWFDTACRCARCRSFR